MEAVREMSQFLNINARLDLKAIALQHVLSESITIRVSSSVNTKAF